MGAEGLLAGRAGAWGLMRDDHERGNRGRRALVGNYGEQGRTGQSGLTSSSSSAVLSSRGSSPCEREKMTDPRKER